VPARRTCARRPACAHVEVGALDGRGIEDRRQEALAHLSPAPLCQPNPDPQLRDGDRRHRDIVVVADRLGKCMTAALGFDQDRRIEDQPPGSLTGSRPSHIP
jgi:hypothetical protein